MARCLRSGPKVGDASALINGIRFSMPKVRDAIRMVEVKGGGWYEHAEAIGSSITLRNRGQ